MTEDQWLALAERHANRDWNCRKPDGYLNAVKALCGDYAALSSASSGAGVLTDAEIDALLGPLPAPEVWSKQTDSTMRTLSLSTYSERQILDARRDAYKRAILAATQRAEPVAEADAPAEVLEDAMAMVQDFGNAMLKRGILSGTSHAKGYAKSFDEAKAAKDAVCTFLARRLATPVEVQGAPTEAQKQAVEDDEADAYAAFVAEGRPAPAADAEVVAWVTPGQDLHWAHSKTPPYPDWMPLYTRPAAPLSEVAADALTGAMDGLLQAGLSNEELMQAWKSKLPGVDPTDRELSAFAVGTEVGFARARALEKSDWSRVHCALKDAGVHPGRTDEHIADVIARALAPSPSPQPTDEATDARTAVRRHMHKFFARQSAFPVSELHKAYASVDALYAARLATPPDNAAGREGQS